MADDVLPQVNIPQPAAGLPNQVPGQPAAGGMFDDLSPAVPKPAAAAAQPAPTKGAFDDLNAAENNYPPKDDSANLPFMDSAKANMSANPEEQSQILNKINPNYKAANENGRTMVNFNGKRMPLDSDTAEGLKALSQHSGDASMFLGTVLPAMLTDGLSEVVEGGAGAFIKIAGSPLKGASGVAMRNYLQNLWTKVKPDSVQATRDMVVAAGITSAADAVMGLGGVAYQKMFAGPAREKQMVEGFKTVLRGVGWDKVDSSVPLPKPMTDFGNKIINPEMVDGQPVGFVQQTISDINSKFEPLVKNAIANSPNGKVSEFTQVKKLLQKEINDKAPGAVDWSYQGVPRLKSFASSEAHTLNDMGQSVDAQTVPYNPQRYAFGTPEGERAVKGLVDDYNKIMVHEQKGGMPFKEFDNMVRGWQQDSQFSPLRSDSFTDRTVRSSFRTAQHVGSEMRLKFLTDNLQGPEQELAKQTYRDYASKIQPAQALLDLYDQNHQVPELFARALLKPENSRVTQGLVSLTKDIRPELVTELRQSFLHSALNEAYSDETGVFDHRSFMKKVDSMGEENRNLVFQGSRLEYEKAKAFSAALSRLSLQKNLQPDQMSKLAKAASYLSPAPRAIGTGSAIVKMAIKNPDTWSQVADQISSNGYGDVPDLLRANTMGRKIKEAIMSARTVKSLGKNSVSAGAATYSTTHESPAQNFMKRFESE